ncbi:MAG: histidinol-phosphate transaminase [Thermomicrobiales bacterium]
MARAEIARRAEAFDLDALIRPAVRAIPGYIPSRLTGEVPTRVVKLDMNESPYGPSPKARAALAAFCDTHRYPDFEATELREALSRYVGAPVDQIVCGAGLDDVINTLALTILDPGDEVIIHEPTFGVYRGLVAHYAGITVDVPLDRDFQLDVDRVRSAISGRTKLIILCTPNNPTGNSLDPTAIERIVAEAPCLVAIDEAYAEFAGTSYRPLMDRYPNVAILRTMSKFAGLAGMRVGYGVFPAALMPHLHRVTPPFHNVTLASTVAAVASLDDIEYVNGIVNRIVADRDALAAHLEEIPGVEAIPSKTNFLLVRLPLRDAGSVVATLAKRGIMVRHFGRPELGIRDCLRVSIGTTAENELFLHALADALRKDGEAA